MVAVLAHALGVIRREFFTSRADVNALATAALYHDAPETLTGDPPTPIIPQRAERSCRPTTVEDLRQKLLGMLPPELRATYADVPCRGQGRRHLPALRRRPTSSRPTSTRIEERKAGNNEFLSAEAQTHAALEASPLPEVQHFLEHFIPAFERDLDELGAIGQYEDNVCVQS